VYQRLSTGQRINRAADDSAGLAIAESLTAKSRIFSRGVQNVSDGLSALTIADSAVEALIQITTRIQELAEQGSSGAYSKLQRSALDKEAQTLRSEFLRIVQVTAFNGRNLLSGDVQGLRIQAGYGVDGSIGTTMGGSLGTGSLNTAASVGIGNQPRAVAMSDFNGDGFQDAVLANRLNNSISILLGDGSGGFQRQDISTGSDPTAVAISDLNGDGIQDIVAANFTGSISVLLGNGNGTFQSSVGYALGGRPSSVAIADFNGDGIQDVVTNDQTNQAVSVLLGNGNGTFGESVSIGAVSGIPGAVVAADFNGDGFADIATATDSGSVSIFLSNGDGTFQGPTDYGASISLESIATADFNGDGRVDIVAGGGGDKRLSVFLGGGDGTFGGERIESAENPVSAVVTADINGDGIQDLVAASATGSSVSILLGAGTGSFSTATVFAAGGAAASLASGDINGDGVPDILTASEDDRAYSVLTSQTRDGVQPILPISLLTQADSKQALSIVSKKLELLTAQRGVLGAAQARLLSSSRSLLSQRDEVIAANSRIRDADIASESAELARTQVVQNAATGVLAQANQRPLVALRLLGL
jgi:flagellin-like hook-associated protein FlgL